MATGGELTATCNYLRKLTFMAAANEAWKGTAEKIGLTLIQAVLKAMLSTRHFSMRVTAGSLFDFPHYGLLFR